MKAVATLVLVSAISVFAPGAISAPVRTLLGIGGAALGATQPGVGRGTYRFMQHQPGDPSSPVTYNRCRPVLVRVNTDGVAAPDQALGIVRSAMEEVSRTSGLRLEYDGSSHDRPRRPTPVWQSGGRALPVLVSFATSREVVELRGAVAGVGGSTSVRRGGVSTYVTGQVTLDIDSFDPLIQRPAFHDSARAIVMHELGHLVGLAHVTDPGELMYAQNSDQTDFGPGDLKGLALLGQGPC